MGGVECSGSVFCVCGSLLRIVHGLKFSKAGIAQPSNCIYISIFIALPGIEHVLGVFAICTVSI